jgi:putative copper resistance protein D
VAIVWGLGLGHGRAGPRRLLLCLVGVSALLVGGYQMVSAMVVDTTPTAWQGNPIASDAQSLARGRELYAANCVTCHGEHGRGAMPARASVTRFGGMDLTADHMEAHSDGDLFWWISKGVRDTAMPSFEDSLTAENRRHLVNYIRSLRHPTRTQP